VVKAGGKTTKRDFVVRTMPVGWLPDLLEPSAVRAFIESTHDLYKIHLKDEFGKVVPGIFTDEPQYTTHFTLSREDALPWTERLPAEFEAEHGYSVLDNLPSLFFDVGSYRKVRYDFFSTVTRLFVEAFSIQLYEWCEENGLKYTGHYEWEDSFLGQIHCIGSAMQHYEYMHQPGIDHLGRGLHNPWVEKQVASVASQLGKDRVLSETYGVSGQSLSFHDRRWIGNWQFAHGVNFLNHHLALYSLRGERKRDYPPTLSPHQPWWNYNTIPADYFTRLSYVMSKGRRIVDVLVLTSLGSAWCEYKPSDHEGVERVFKGFTELTESLLSQQIDFEYGEEFLLEKHGKVQGKRLVLGKSRYRVVILPPMKSIRASTLELIRRFAEAGGCVILVGEMPGLVEGEESEELVSFVSSLRLVPNEDDAISSTVRPMLSKGPSINWISGAEIEHLLVHRRKIGSAELLFVVNTDHGRTMRIRIDFATSKPVRELLPLTGEIRSCPSTHAVDLPGGDGKIFVEGIDAEADGSCDRVPGDLLCSEPLSATWEIRREDPNIAVMDFARYRLPGGRLSGLLPVWQVQDEVKERTGEFEVRYEFDVSRRGPIDLVVEEAHRYDVYVNDSKVNSRTGKWWLDPSFVKMPIGDLVKPGKNTVTIKGRYDSDMSIEDAYLLGDFSVEVDGRRTPQLTDEKPIARNLADIREAGYPFYAGALELRGEVNIPERNGTPWIEFDGLGGTIAEISLNGTDLGTLFWREYRLPAQDVLKPGKNEISIRLVNDLRNLLGPRHWTEGEFTGVNPTSFRDGHGWTDSYVGVPLGIDGLRIVWRSGG